MFRRNEVLVSRSGALPSPRPGPGPTEELDALVEPRPVFRAALRGYDRLQVDTYVAWAGTELLAVRRANDDLLTRYGACSAELEISRRLLACSPAGREQVRTSERVGEILRLAADEAARLTEAGAVDADRIRAVARAEADALLRRAREVRDDAVADCERMRAEAEDARAAAEEQLARAHAEVRRLTARLDAVLQALVGEERPDRAPLAG
ncbi:DivIVA domain-containing protein [Geodermatophilus sp. URMC 61]|uniref:DivIVA domain-containing protein n=1 Tax=Geodermatophilus sp. URMC 61 TaxID=3423411 RepID=UPI00406C5AA1